jgi:hypothetical protein
MSRKLGKFDIATIQKNLDHMKDPKNVAYAPSPTVKYYIPPGGDLAKKLKALVGPSRATIGPTTTPEAAPAQRSARPPEEVQQPTKVEHTGSYTEMVHTTTLAQPTLASLLYMDVGLWAGDGPNADFSPATWGRRRDFGVVCGRLALLCSYTGVSHPPTAPPPPPTAPPPPPTADISRLSPAVVGGPEFQKVKPLLDHLSSKDQNLGIVKVTRALLGREDLATPPKDDIIHVFLGDLHAPVVTDPLSPPRPPMAGRYKPSLLVEGTLRALVPYLKKIVENFNRKDLKSIFAMRSDPHLLLFPVELATVMAALWADTPLNDWPGGIDQSDVDHWLRMYHTLPGGAGAKGAEIFEHAGTDLMLWLDLLIGYGSTPIRLAQLGDLFDLWLGLKCAFSEKGVLYPTAYAEPFAKFWCREIWLQNPAIKKLLAFPYSTTNLKPIFLYGNHDNYRYKGGPLKGTLFEADKQNQEPDSGFVAQHGHQEDAFNSDDYAKKGYLLTQAAFAEPEARFMEDPMSALFAALTGGIGPRLTYTEMALEECVFNHVDPVVTGQPQPQQRPAMTFIMGHTHEPVLQEILVIEGTPPDP